MYLLTSAVSGDKRSTNYMPDRFTSTERTPHNNWIRAWVDPRTRQDKMESKESCSYRDLNSEHLAVQPVASRHPSSHNNNSWRSPVYYSNVGFDSYSGRGSMPLFYVLLWLEWMVPRLRSPGQCLMFWIISEAKQVSKNYSWTHKHTYIVAAVDIFNTNLACCIFYFLCTRDICGSRDNVVGIETDYGSEFEFL
jgi:hypothetical protein